MYREDIDETPKVLHDSSCILRDLDCYNDNTDAAVRVYVYDKASASGITPGSGQKWTLEIPPGAESPARAASQGRSWDSGLALKYGCVLVAKTVAGGNPTSDIRVNYTIKDL